MTGSSTTSVEDAFFAYAKGKISLSPSLLEYYLKKAGDYCHLQQPLLGMTDVKAVRNVQQRVSEGNLLRFRFGKDAQLVRIVTQLYYSFVKTYRELKDRSTYHNPVSFDESKAETHIVIAAETPLEPVTEQQSATKEPSKEDPGIYAEPICPVQDGGVMQEDQEQSTHAERAKGTASLEGFKVYLLEKQHLADRTAGNYCTSIRMIEEYIRHNDLGVSLISASAESIQAIIDFLMSRADFVEINDQRHHQYSAAMSQYARFLRESTQQTRRSHADTGTIAEAVTEVLKSAQEPLTLAQIYDEIIERGLYRFYAQNPMNVLQNAIAAACQGFDRKAKASVLLFGSRIGDNGKRVFYLLLDESKYYPMSKSDTLSQEITTLLKKNPSGVDNAVIKDMLGVLSKTERLELLLRIGCLYVNGKWYLKAQIEDFDIMADVLLEVLIKQFSTNNGYTSAKQLYQEARGRLDDFFFYNGGFDSQIEIFDFAIYLFGRTDYKGYRFIFSNGMHIWREEPNYTKDFCGLTVKYAREHGNTITRSEAIEYYEWIGSASPAQTFSNMLLNYGKRIFLQYDENRFVLWEALHVDEAFINQLVIQINHLLEDDSFVPMGDINEYFYSTLPALPSSIYWTPLLLQSVLRVVDTPFATLPARDNADVKTVDAALIRRNAGYLRFSDVLWEAISQEYTLPHEFTSADFRQYMLNKGFIHGSEHIFTVEKVTEGDIRFYWSENNKLVTVSR